MAAREIQFKRYGAHINQANLNAHCNAHINGQLLRHYCRIDNKGEELLHLAMSKLKLSARAHDHILKISRTIADLAGSEEIRSEHLAEAIQFRSLDRERWAA